MCRNTGKRIERGKIPIYVSSEEIAIFIPSPRSVYSIQ
jgi:hypothetical protein